MALLNVRHLRKGYGDTVVLQDLDLSLEKGEVVVILGPSGSGKSSLLRCINGLEPHQGGSIKMEGVGEFGKDVPWETARQKVGMVFQSYELFAHMNVIDNILLGPLKAQGRLCMNPEVILLDEITAALDPEMVREVLDVVLELAREGMSMLIVTHEMEFAAKVADRIIFMDQGHIIEESTPDKFFTKPESGRAQQFLSGMDYSI